MRFSRIARLTPPPFRAPTALDQRAYGSDATKVNVEQIFKLVSPGTVSKDSLAYLVIIDATYHRLAGPEGRMVPMRVAPEIMLTDEVRGTLRKWSRGRATPARLVRRAQIILLAAEGKENL